MKWTQRAAWLLGTVGLLACGGAKQTPDIPPDGAIQKRLTLQSFASCQELEQYIEDTAVLQMKTQLEQARDNTYYGGVAVGDATTAGGKESAPPMSPTPTAAGADSAGSGGSNTAAPTSHTTTNTQVAGVDEADFVKNDGTRIFVLTGNKLYIQQSWPADQLKTLSSLEVEGWPREMFLDEANHIVVFSQVQTEGLYPTDIYPMMPCDGMYCGYGYSNAVKVTVIDVADLAAPKVADQYYLPGQYSNSRRIGSSVRIVLSDSFRWPLEMKWWPDYQPGIYENETLRKAAFNSLIQSNEVLIRGQAIDKWLPQTKRKLADGTLVPLPYNCSEFSRVNASVRLGMLTVATLNLAKPGTLGRTSIVADSGVVYASSQHLYVANQHWWWWPEIGQEDWTYAHKFDISNPDAAVYVASGGIPGHLNNQFSLDEDVHGYLRVASTVAKRVPDTQNSWNTWGRMETVNRVTVFGENAGELVEMGRTEDMAPGERIFAARFHGPRAYVVTFRQVDPFYTIDLSNPTQPKKVGELKIPGFSTYLHPVDENHVLAIGTYQPENGDWSARAIKLSLFDVSNFAAPVEKYSQLVGTAYSYSEAQYDHKAFNYFAEKKLLAIPFSDWNSGWTGDSYWSSFTSDLRVFHIDPAVGITPRGALSMKDLYQVQNYYGWSYYWSPAVRRSVMADDFVYAISDAGIRVANIATLGTPISTVQFSPYQLSK